MPSFIKKYLPVVLFALGIIFVGYYVERSDFLELILGFSFLFVVFLLIWKKRKDYSLKELFWIALGLKTILLFSVPNLSEDYLRFMWDGQMTLEGKNAYQHIPENIIDDSELAPEGKDYLYPEMNSKIYYSVYPPINQLVFLSSVITGKNLELFFLKFFILLSEIGIFILLKRLLVYFHKNPLNLILYTLNPLIIIETIGNCHFEGMVFFFLLLAVWLWVKEKKWLSPIAYSIAIGTKLIPLMFLPFLFRKIGFKQTVIYCSLVGICIVLMFLPFINQELISNFWQSLDLYFQSFEFNASVFYVVREVGFWWKGWDVIQTAGPGLTIIAGVLILIIAFQNKIFKDQFFEKILLAFTIYLLFATTVHPWYIITLVGISVFTNFRYPLVWSYLVLLSYSHYLGGGMEEKFGWIGLEYLVLFGMMIYEFYRFRAQVSR